MFAECLPNQEVRGKNPYYPTSMEKSRKLLLLNNTRECQGIQLVLEAIKGMSGKVVVFTSSLK